MVPEVLLALLGVPGEVITLVPATSDGGQERFRVSPDLPFLEPPERASLDRLVSLGYAFRCLERFVAREDEAGTTMATLPSGPEASFAFNAPASGGSLYRRALAAGVSDVLAAYESAILRLEQDILRGVTPALPAALESALSGFTLVLPALHVTYDPSSSPDLKGAPLLHHLHAAAPPRARPARSRAPIAARQVLPRRTSSSWRGPCTACWSTRTGSSGSGPGGRRRRRGSTSATSTRAARRRERPAARTPGGSRINTGLDDSIVDGDTAGDGGRSWRRRRDPTPRRGNVERRRPGRRRRRARVAQGLPGIARGFGRGGAARGGGCALRGSRGEGADAAEGRVRGRVAAAGRGGVEGDGGAARAGAGGGRGERRGV